MDPPGDGHTAPGRAGFDPGYSKSGGSARTASLPTHERPAQHPHPGAGRHRILDSLTSVNDKHRHRVSKETRCLVSFNPKIPGFSKKPGI